MVRVRLLAAAALMGLLSACAPSLGPPPPGAVAPARPGVPTFRASEFEWSQQPGTGAIVGHLAFTRQGARYTCKGDSVILTPETPWSKLRMEVLYLSSERAALPTDQVRARTAEAPPGDSTPFIKRVTCDAANRFSFVRLPAGAWYVITIAKPVNGGGPSFAVMKRVETHAGKVTTVGL
ncbi:MAG: hypothetical protein KGO51_17450 [Alphaproteobacteria bacterium]|nr:hypothetical protein [Alphaproteobacteria bacterium]